MNFLERIRNENAPKAGTLRRHRSNSYFLKAYQDWENNKRFDRKVESNDSPEIPDTGGRHQKPPPSLPGR